MAVTFTLVEVTPHRLRYACVDDGEGGTGTITNTGVGSEDLRGDMSRIEGSPLDNLVSTPVASQAEARTLLEGEFLTAAADINTPRAHLKLTPKTIANGGGVWAADADLGAGGSAGYAVINVTGIGVSAVCYLDVEFEHSLIR